MNQIQVVEIELEALRDEEETARLPLPSIQPVFPSAPHRPLSRWIIKFLLHLEATGDKSDNTLRHYAHDLDLFSRYLKAHAPHIATPHGVTSKTVTGFLRYMRVVRGNSSSSNRRRLASLRRFFGYLLHTGAIASDPTAPVPREQHKRQPTGVLTRSEALRFLEAAKSTSFPSRDYAIFRLFLSCGCTLSELLSLTVNDFDPDRGMITFVGRKGATRSIPLSPACCEALSTYLSDRPKAPAARHLFLNRRGHAVTKGAIYHAFRQVLRRAEIDKPRITVHSLRRTCLTLLWEGGMSLHALQQIAGHTSLSTTKGYVQARTRGVAPAPGKWKDPLEG